VMPAQQRAPELIRPHDDLDLLRDDDRAGVVHLHDNATSGTAGDDDLTPGL
jgi:hypothetical protein